MIERRSVFDATTALARIITSGLEGRSASAQNFEFDVENRGTSGRLERLPKLDLESRDDFFVGMRRWRSETAAPKAMRRFNAILASNGHDPKKDLPLAQIIELVKDDPVINTQVRIFLDAKRTAHKNYKREYEENADLFLKEMESYDSRGPGILELNPEQKVPKYTSHEIHQQPGGYVGSAFSGPVYHHGTNSFYLARAIPNKQDQHHSRLSSQIPKPEDDRVDRILDMGCGVGQLTVALKERFSDAEVWGVDIAAPMIRYGHMRAVDLAVEVNFVHALAEKTNFPDNHFDIVTSYILHHEVTAEATQQIIAEAYRVLRPGGVFFPIDFHTGGKRRRNAWGAFSMWIDHRWNNEVWREEYESVDFPRVMRAVGFDATEAGPPAWRNRRNVLGVKRA